MIESYMCQYLIKILHDMILLGVSMHIVLHQRSLQKQDVQTQTNNSQKNKYKKIRKI